MGGLEGAHARNSGKEIQTSIGFTNLGGDDLNAMLQDDVAALSPLFEHVIVAPARSVFARAASFRLFSLQRETSQKAASVPGPSRHTLTFPIAILHDPVSEAIRLDRSVCD